MCTNERSPLCGVYNLGTDRKIDRLGEKEQGIETKFAVDIVEKVGP